MLYLSTNFETRYLLCSCSNQSIDKKFRFSPKFMLKVLSSVFRNRCVSHLWKEEKRPNFSLFFVVSVPSVILFAQEIKSLIAVKYQASPIRLQDECNKTAVHHIPHCLDIYRSMISLFIPHFSVCSPNISVADKVKKWFICTFTSYRIKKVHFVVVVDVWC